jgi:septal ring-binding cell division protein DamX
MTGGHAVLSVGRMALRAGVLAAGLMSVGQSARLSAQSAPQLVAAVKLAQDGQGDSARAELTRMLEATPGGDTLYPQILYTLGMVADNTEDRQRMFQRVVIEYSTSDWADESLFRLAQVAYAASDWPTATRYLDRIRADFPGSPLLGYAALYGARAQFQTGDAAAACRWITDGLGRARESELRQALEAERQRCTESAIAAAQNRPAEPQAPDNTRTTAPAAAPQSTIGAPGARYRVQVAAVGSRAAADDLVAKLRDMNVEGLVVRDGALYKVRAGAYQSREEAGRAAEALRARFGGQPFIVAAN